MKDGATWDLSRFFPTFGGAEMTDFRENLRKDLDRLMGKARGLRKLEPETYGDWESLLESSESLFARLIHYSSYIGCLESAYAANEDYQRESGALATMDAEFDKLIVELKRALKGISEKTFAEFRGRPAMAPIGFFIDRLRLEARHMLKPDLEVLAADLAIDGFSAWGRLYSRISGKMEFELVYPDGRKEMKPMSQRYALMENSDPDIRKAAFEGGNAAWARMEDVTSAALNHIAGTRLLFNRYRGIDDILYQPLFQSHISRKTLDAMFQALRSEREFIRRIGKAKAGAYGATSLAWYDMEAPLPIADSASYSWDEGVKLVGTSFHRVFPELGEFFDYAVKSRWIESETRSGKRPGAFCTGSTLIEESRVFMTFGGSLGDVQTLAHEIGHGYHSHVMKGMRVFSRFYPNTLAESASTFAEMILTDGILSDQGVPDSRKAVVLNMSLGNAMVFLMNIPVRFEFEKRFHDERAKGEVPPTRIKELMVQTQREVFGDVLAKGGEDPYFWASKLHFYLTGVCFYNFPYTFGFLLSRGLFKLFKEQGGAFLPNYKEFLRFSGSACAEEVARSAIGCDLSEPDFWRNAIRSLEDELALFEKLVPSTVSPQEYRESEFGSSK